MMLVTNFLTVGYVTTNPQEYPQKSEFFSGEATTPHHHPGNPVATSPYD